MAWTIKFTKTAEKQLQKIDKKWQSIILDYLENEISPLQNPKTRGKKLLGDKGGIWRFRVGDYGILCDIQNTICIILVITIGHRKEVYK